MPKNTKTENSSTKKSATKTAKAEPKVEAKAEAKPKAEPKVAPAAEPAPVEASKKAQPSKKVAKKETKKATPKKAAKKATEKKSAKKATPKKAAKKTASKSGGKKEKKVEPKPAEAEGESHGRYFKVVIGEDGPHGRFSGSKPKQAAAKALTSILRSREESGTSVEGQIKFSIVECTRGSRHKTYNYIGERVELDKPMEITIGKGADAKVITYKYNNKVMKDKSA